MCVVFVAVAVWTLVKQMLSEDEQKHVIFCKKNTIQEYIEPDQLFTYMGGTVSQPYLLYLPLHSHDLVTY